MKLSTPTPLNLKVIVNDRTQSEVEAWERFMALQKRALETGRAEDGLAAKRAYGKFLDLPPGKR